MRFSRKAPAALIAQHNKAFQQTPNVTILLDNNPASNLFVWSLRTRDTPGTAQLTAVVMLH